MNDSKQQLSSESESEQVEPSTTPSKKKEKKASNKNKNKIVINISDCQYPVVSKVAKHFGWKLQSNSEAMDWDICWTDNAVQPETLSKMELHQKINHFPGMYNLARKNLLGRGLMRMKKNFPSQYDFFPMTWMLPVEYHELKTYFQSKAKGKARTFIVKPQCLSQGKGIFLTRKLQDINPSAHCVVQRYLHRPYLIDGLKFDLRVYVLISCVDPLTIYLYEEGLGRFATEKYEAPTRENMEEVCMHLTNYAINKDNPKFVFNESEKDMSKGHKRSLTSVFELLKEKGVDVEKLKAKMKDCIIKTMISGLPHLTNTYKSCQPESYASNMCFQLLGFDVMINEKAQPIVLEINHTPSFTTDTPLDHHIKFNYIKDALTIMNINEKYKNQVIKQQRQACQQRVITGKKIKLTVQERQAKKKQAIEKRLKYEAKHIGKFQRIYPLNTQEDPYAKYIQFVDEVFQVSMGGAKKVPKKPQKQEIKPPVPKSKVKRPTFATTPDLVSRGPLGQRKYQSKKSINLTQGQNKQQRQISIKSGSNLVSSPSEIDRHLLQQIQLKSKIEKTFQNHYPKTPEQISNPKTLHDFLQQKTPKQFVHYKHPQDEIKFMMNNFTKGSERDMMRDYREIKSIKNMERSTKDDSFFKRFSKEKQKLVVVSKLNPPKDKIPIALNTLLINGIQQNHNFAPNNFKKFVINKNI